MRTLDEERYISKLNRNETDAIKSELKLQAGVIGAFLAIFWGVYLFNNVFTEGWISTHLALEAWTWEGFLGMWVTPFVNLSIFHVIFHSIALVFLGWWVMLRDTRDFFVVHLASLLASGFAVWIFEASNIRWHGWGGIAFGMMGYLLTAGLFERRWATILSSMVALFVLGGTVGSALIPGAVASWFGIAGGFLGGVLASAYLGLRRRNHADPEDLVGGLRPAVSSSGSSASGSADVTLDFDEAAEIEVDEEVEVGAS